MAEHDFLWPRYPRLTLATADSAVVKVLAYHRYSPISASTRLQAPRWRMLPPPGGRVAEPGLLQVARLEPLSIAPASRLRALFRSTVAELITLEAGL